VANGRRPAGSPATCQAAACARYAVFKRARRQDVVTEPGWQGSAMQVGQGVVRGCMSQGPNPEEAMCAV